MADEEFPEWTLLESAIAMHEMYLTYVKAGFTEDQALKLVAAIVSPRE